MTKLENMLQYVSEHNEFYKSRIKEFGIKNPLDITQWPILTRKELQENRYNMFSDGYKARYYNQQLIRQSSSGSSGIPVNVYWDYKDWYASNLSLWRRRLQWYGIKPSENYVKFTLNVYNIKNDSETIYYIQDPANILTVNVSLIQNESAYNKVVDIINKFQPNWLYVQPFVLNKLIQAYKRLKKSPPRTLKYIESVGELLSSDLRRRAVEFFNVPLANMYGSEEMNGIAYESPKHEMNVLESNIFLETNDIGEAIISNLNNYAMPLIRYNQGDNIELKSNNSNKLQIKVINGRSWECIVLPDGSELSPYPLIDAVSDTNNHLKDIICDFKFTYIKHTNSLEYSLTLCNEQWGNTTYTLFEDNLRKRIGYNISLIRKQFPSIKSHSSSVYSFQKKKILEFKEN